MNEPLRPDPSPQPTAPGTDLPRVTLGVLCIAGLILAAFWVLRPFIGPAIWAAMIVVATWPLQKEGGSSEGQLAYQQVSALPQNGGERGFRPFKLPPGLFYLFNFLIFVLTPS